MVFFTSFYQFFLFVWKSILSDIRMAVPGLFFLSAWDIPFHSLVFRLCVSLLVGCFLQVASRWVIFFFYSIQSVCIFGEFRSFLFWVIINLILPFYQEYSHYFICALCLY